MKQKISIPSFIGCVLVGTVAGVAVAILMTGVFVCRAIVGMR